MSSSWRGGSTRRWRKLRRRVFALKGQACTLRIPGVCTSVATHVHHTLGKAHGDQLEQLEPACGPCNLHLGQPKPSDPRPNPRTKW